MTGARKKLAASGATSVVSFYSRPHVNIDSIKA